MAAAARVELDRWEADFEELMARIAPRFARVEPRRHARGLILGLLAGLPRANCWTIAEHAGDARPGGLQHFLAAARWDTDAVADDLRDYVVDQLGGDDAAVLVVDETGDVKKGAKTVGVQRQYTGTAGRIENSQVAVYLAYATPRGCAFLDRALYLPRSWTDDADRMAQAGVPDGTGFATKPVLATAMIARALDAGVPAGWVTGDEVYGQDPRLRAELIDRGVSHVLAVARDHRVRTGIGVRRAVEVAVRVPAGAWQPLSAGAGAKGERIYHWALVDLVDGHAQGPADDAATSHGRHGLLIRRNRQTRELAFYRTWTPGPVRLHRLVQVAGTRWRIEEGFQTAKELTGLDEHQVRTWTSWHRWTILALLAHAFLTVLTAAGTGATDKQVHQPADQPPSEPSPASRADPSNPLIALTRNEMRRLFTTLIHSATRALHTTIAWSHWRRRHQALAKHSHYQRQARLT